MLFPKISLVYDHYEKAHLVQFIYKNLSFKSFEEFEEWRSELQTATFCQFVKCACNQTPTQKVNVYGCHWSNCNEIRKIYLHDKQPESARYRLSGGHCPAEIEVTCNRVDGSCAVKFQKIHVGHATKDPHKVIFVNPKNVPNENSAARMLLDAENATNENIAAGVQLDAKDEPNDDSVAGIQSHAHAMRMTDDEMQIAFSVEVPFSGWPEHDIANIPIDVDIAPDVEPVEDDLEKAKQEAQNLLATTLIYAKNAAQVREITNRFLKPIEPILKP